MIAKWRCVKLYLTQSFKKLERTHTSTGNTFDPTKPLKERQKSKLELITELVGNILGL